MSGGAFTDGAATTGAATTGAAVDIVVIGVVVVDDSRSGCWGEYPASEDAKRVGCAITGLPVAEEKLDEAGRTNPSTLCVKHPAANTTGSQV